MALLPVPRLNAYASFMEMTINRTIGEAVPRLDYSQATQANQLAKEMLPVAHAAALSSLMSEMVLF